MAAFGWKIKDMPAAIAVSVSAVLFTWFGCFGRLSTTRDNPGDLIDF